MRQSSTNNPLKRSSSHLSKDKFFTARRRMDTPLDLVSDNLDADAHARMDQAVLEYFQDEPLANTTLLATIVSTSEGLNPEYEKTQNAKALLKEHPKLADMLRVAWDQKTFREIRNLGAFARIAV